MKKKIYISPVLEVADLRAMNATMQAFGDASMPQNPFSAPKHVPALGNDSIRVF